MKFMDHILKNLDSLINDGLYHGVIVLKNTNKRCKQRDAWTYVTHNFNKFFGTSFDNKLVWKKYTYEKTAMRGKLPTENIPRVFSTSTQNICGTC